MSGSTYWTHRDWDYSLSYGGHRDDDKGYGGHGGHGGGYGGHYDDDDKGYGHYTPYADGWFA
jgi:hypothetical protein